MDVKTVRRYLRAEDVEQLVAGGVRTSKLDPFKPYLHQRLTAGARIATALHEEIVAQGYTGSYPILERYLKPLRRTDTATLAQVVREPAAARAAGHRLDYRPARPPRHRRRSTVEGDPCPVPRDRRRRGTCRRASPA